MTNRNAVAWLLTSVLLAAGAACDSHQPIQGGGGEGGGQATGGAGGAAGGGAGGTASGDAGHACGPVCQIYCPWGNVLDQYGCPTCQCNPTPATCDKCPPPAPMTSPPRCADGSIPTGPVCAPQADGTCQWVPATCPACVNNGACIAGAHWDPTVCKCVPTTTNPCNCPGDQVCVTQIGGPATATQPSVTCMAPSSACASSGVAVSPCLCLDAGNGTCTQSQSDSRACTCDNGAR